MAPQLKVELEEETSAYSINLSDLMTHRSYQALLTSSANCINQGVVAKILHAIKHSKVSNKRTCF